VHPAPRLHYLDNLRALAMLAGVVFHAALAYSPLMHPFWPTADAGHARWVDALAWFLHLFRMPLFFAVAGFFAALLVQRRGLAGMLRNRAARVLLPLVLLGPLLLVSLHWLTAQAVDTVQQPSPVLAWLRVYRDEHGALPLAPSLAHLWFLFYLMIFCVLVWVGTALGWGRPLRAAARLPAAALVLAGPLVLAPALIGVSAPWPAPELFLPQPWALLFFGAFFAFGYQLQRHEGAVAALRPWAPWLLGGAVAAYLAFGWLARDGGLVAPRWPARLAMALLQAYAGAWMTLWCLHAGSRWLAGRSAGMRYLADASYWIYLVHLPVLFALQYRLMDLAAPWQAKLAIAVAATFALCLASYHWAVRGRALGRLLNGDRRGRPAA
jgi:peptidoglycan/LPS O-acetylase OafA/YrhL